jgi:acyl-CoA synthetase (NDP forming)
MSCHRNIGTLSAFRGDQSPDLTPLLSPRSIAVVGASASGGRASGVVRNLIELGFDGAIYPINPKYDSVMGLRCFPNLQDVPGSIDCVAIAIPGDKILPVLWLAHEKKARAAVIFASGYGEAGEIGKRHQTELEAFIAQTGMLICGPNCLGAIDVHAKTGAYSSISPKDIPAGRVAVVSQSGSVLVALVRNPRGIAYCHLISSGNEIGVCSGDYLNHFVRDPNTGVLAAFMEDIKHPLRFIAAAEAARTNGKPLIVLKTGRSEIGSAASAAHTGSLAGSYDVQKALFRQKGVVHCEDLDEWMEAIQLFELAKPPKAPGIGIVGVSGGENALLLDHAAELNLQIPKLSRSGREKLAAVLPWYGRPENPVDATGQIAADPDLYAHCLSILAEEPSIGVIIVSQDSPAVFDALAAQAVAEVAKRSEKTFVYLNNFSAPLRADLQIILRQAGVPYLQGLREGLKAVQSFIAFHASSKKPAPARSTSVNKQRQETASALLKMSSPYLCEDTGKALLSLYGFTVPREIRVQSADDAEKAAERVGFPVAAKILSPDIAHKMNVGGVHLDLRSAGEVKAAYGELLETVGRLSKSANTAGVLIQPMVGGKIELILGMKRDIHFGSTIAFGLGGEMVEAIRSVSLRVAPLTESDAIEMVADLQPLKAIVERIRPGFDFVPALSRLLLQFSELVAELGSQISEIDINPVKFDPATGAATVVDALIVPQPHP